MPNWGTGAGTATKERKRVTPTRKDGTGERQKFEGVETLSALHILGLSPVHAGRSSANVKILCE